jgi:hypothetical protein
MNYDVVVKQRANTTTTKNAAQLIEKKFRQSYFIYYQLRSGI